MMIPKSVNSVDAVMMVYNQYMSLHARSHFSASISSLSNEEQTDWNAHTADWS